MLWGVHPPERALFSSENFFALHSLSNVLTPLVCHKHWYVQGAPLCTLFILRMKNDALREQHSLLVFEYNNITFWRAANLVYLTQSSSLSSLLVKLEFIKGLETQRLSIITKYYQKISHLFPPPALWVARFFLYILNGITY